MLQERKEGLITDIRVNTLAKKAREHGRSRNDGDEDSDEEGRQAGADTRQQRHHCAQPDASQ